MEKKLPTFEFLVDDTIESGVKAIAIVKDPAFGSGLIAFEKSKPKFIKLESEGKKQIVAGFSLLPDVPVYRIDPEFGEYMGYFSAETIEKIVEKYHEEMLTNQVNLDHNDEMYIDAYMVEDFIVNSEKRQEDLAAKGLEHPNSMGAWYTAFKIKNAEVFAAIEESGTATGFSVEAYLDKFMKQFNEEVKNKTINLKVKQEMKKNNKSIKERILSIFAETEKLERALVPELAFEIEWNEVGEPVNQVIPAETEDGEETYTPIGQGEFVTELGIVVVDEASNLVEIRELPVEDVVEPAPEDEMAVTGDTSGTTSGTTETIAEIVAPVDPELPAPTGVTETVDETLGIEKSILEVVGTVDGDYAIQVKVEGGVVTEAVAQSAVNLMLSEQYNFGDMEKRLKELIPTDKAGNYTISVDVDAEGNYTWGTVQSWTTLKFHSEAEVEALNAKIIELEEKIKEPITDPILTPEVTEPDFKKMSAYQKLMYKKGIQAV